MKKQKLISYFLDFLIIIIIGTNIITFILDLLYKNNIITIDEEVYIAFTYIICMIIILKKIFKKEKTIGKYIAKKIIKDENKKFTLKEIIIIIIIINGYFLFKHFFLKWRNKKIEKVQKINENAPKDNHNFKNILKKNAKTVKKETKNMNHFIDNVRSNQKYDLKTHS